MEYFRIRKSVIFLTLVFLFIGSILYFYTGVAERNTEMMYKKIYGENATLNGVDIRNDDSNTKYDSDIKIFRYTGLY